MHSSKILGCRMEVTLQDGKFMFVIYYLMSKLFGSKSFSRTEKHFILDFKN